jgi:hypothetical protein
VNDVQSGNYREYQDRECQFPADGYCSAAGRWPSHPGRWVSTLPLSGQHKEVKREGKIIIFSVIIAIVFRERK